MNDDVSEVDEAERIESDASLEDDGGDWDANDRLEEANSVDELQLERDKKAEAVKEILLDRSDLPETAARRLEEARDIKVLGPEEYAAELHKRGKTDQQITDISGIHYGGEDLTLVRDDGPTIVTLAHENYHVASENNMPTGLDEGVTEVYARRASGGVGDMLETGGVNNPLEAPARSYDNEARLVSQLEAMVGGKAISDAYFDGDDSQLRALVDARAGEGAYESFGQALDKEDYEAARQVIAAIEKDFHRRGY